jgi:type I restriction enzyme, S subunit
MKKGWEIKKLGDIAAVQSGAGFPDRYQGQSNGEIPFYKVSDMNLAGNERDMIRENNSITEEVRRELGAFLFPEGSTIFRRSAVQLQLTRNVLRPGTAAWTTM